MDKAGSYGLQGKRAFHRCSFVLYSPIDVLGSINARDSSLLGA